MYVRVVTVVVLLCTYSVPVYLRTVHTYPHSVVHSHPMMKAHAVMTNLRTYLATQVLQTYIHMCVHMYKFYVHTQC